MLAAEGLVRSAGIKELGLSVFGSNDSAKSLYDSIGYREVGLNASKSRHERLLLSQLRGATAVGIRRGRGQFTHQAALGIHGAMIRAGKPAT